MRALSTMLFPGMADDLSSDVSLVVGAASPQRYDGTGLMRSLGEAGEETAGVLTRTQGLTPSCQSLVPFNCTVLGSTNSYADGRGRPRPGAHWTVSLLCLVTAKTNPLHFKSAKFRTSLSSFTAWQLFRIANQLMN